MFEFIVNVQVAVVRDGKFLFIVRGEEEEYLPGVKGLPGGKVEQGDIETGALEATGIREVVEETGMKVSPDLRYVRSNVFNDRILNVVMMARWESGEPFAKSSGEVAECVWLSALEAAADASLPEWEREHIRIAESLRGDLGW